MLNNVELIEGTRAVFEHECGEVDETIIERLVDSRDTLDNYKENMREWAVNEHSWRGFQYWSGEVQTGIGKTRQTFVFVPQGEWNIVLIY